MANTARDLLWTTLLAALLGSLLVLATAESARAHHGWGEFDTERPLYLEGTVADVSWRDPHPEVVLEVPEGVRVPDDVESVEVPAELEDLGFEQQLANASVPEDAVRRWPLVLAPISRLQVWGMPEPPREGERLAVIGYRGCDHPDELRPALVILEDGTAVRQQSVPLPSSGCAGAAPVGADGGALAAGAPGEAAGTDGLMGALPSPSVSVGVSALFLVAAVTGLFALRSRARG